MCNCNQAGTNQYDTLMDDTEALSAHGAYASSIYAPTQRMSDNVVTDYFSRLGSTDKIAWGVGATAVLGTLIAFGIRRMRKKRK